MSFPNPKNSEELATLKIDFPRLAADSVDGCPVTMEKIQEYLAMEDADAEDVDTRDLHFIRTALVEKTRYWIWDYHEQDGEHCYVTVSQGPPGICLGMSGDLNNLTPEQYILGDYQQIY